MKCKECGDEMGLEFVDDSGSNLDTAAGYAYNVFNCARDGMMAKESVWSNPGVLWISALDVVTRWAKRGEDRRQKKTHYRDRPLYQFRRNHGKERCRRVADDD